MVVCHSWGCFIVLIAVSFGSLALGEASWDSVSSLMEKPTWWTEVPEQQPARGWGLLPTATWVNVEIDYRAKSSLQMIAASAYILSDFMRPWVRIIYLSSHQIPHPLTQRDKINAYCFKLLSFGLICYAAINNTKRKVISIRWGRIGIMVKIREMPSHINSCCVWMPIYIPIFLNHVAWFRGENSIIYKKIINNHKSITQVLKYLWMTHTYLCNPPKFSLHVF